MEDYEKNTRKQKLEELLFKLRRARWLHRKASKHYQPKNILLVSLSFFLSSSIGMLSIGNTDTDSKTTNKFMGYTITVIGFINGLLVLISNHLDYKTKINNNKLATKAYDRLITQVSFELNFPSNIPCKEFVAHIEESILKLKDELEITIEERFEKEVNKFIEDGNDISSEAGYNQTRKGFLNIFKNIISNRKTSPTSSEINSNTRDRLNEDFNYNLNHNQNHNHNHNQEDISLRYPSSSIRANNYIDPTSSQNENQESYNNINSSSRHSEIMPLSSFSINRI